MADFRVVLAGAPAFTIPVWTDPASATRPSRVVGDNDRQFRKIVCAINTVLNVKAIMDDASVVEADTVVGLFQMWVLERPTAGDAPLQAIVTPGTSAEQNFTLTSAGHYTIGVRHLDTNAGAKSRPGGAVLFHVEVTTS